MNVLIVEDDVPASTRIEAARHRRFFAVTVSADWSDGG
jgi:hypothetical protein